MNEPKASQMLSAKASLQLNSGSDPNPPKMRARDERPASLPDYQHVQGGSSTATLIVRNDGPQQRRSDAWVHQSVNNSRRVVVSAQPQIKEVRSQYPSRASPSGVLRTFVSS